MHQHNMKWLPFKKRCEFRLLCLIHTTLILSTPGYLRGLLVRRQLLQNLRSSDSTLLKLPNGCNAMHSLSFFRIAPDGSDLERDDNIYECE